MDYKATDFTPDLRRMRAMELTSHIMQIIGKYITNYEDGYLKKAHQDLFDALYFAGVEVITDHVRSQNGLPPRGPKGWTNEELHIMEQRRIQAMLAPIPPIIIAKNEPLSP